MSFYEQLPILQELLGSDLVVFYVLGMAAAYLCAGLIRNIKLLIVGAAASLIVYLFCEMSAAANTDYGVLFLVMIIGAMALGSCLGFLIRLGLTKNIRK